MNEWISIDEQLPSNNTYVLVHCEGGNITESFFSLNRKLLAYSETLYRRKRQGKSSGYFDISHKYGYKITH